MRLITLKHIFYCIFLSSLKLAWTKNDGTTFLCRHLTLKWTLDYSSNSTRVWLNSCVGISLPKEIISVCMYVLYLCMYSLCVSQEMFFWSTPRLACVWLGTQVRGKLNLVQFGHNRFNINKLCFVQVHDGASGFCRLIQECQRETVDRIKIMDVATVMSWFEIVQTIGVVCLWAYQFLLSGVWCWRNWKGGIHLWGQCSLQTAYLQLTRELIKNWTDKQNWSWHWYQKNLINSHPLSQPCHTH